MHDISNPGCNFSPDINWYISQSREIRLSLWLFSNPFERQNDFIVESLCIPCYLMLRKVRQREEVREGNMRNTVELSCLAAYCIVISRQMEESRHDRRLSDVSQPHLTLPRIVKIGVKQCRLDRNAAICLRVSWRLRILLRILASASGIYCSFKCPESRNYKSEDITWKQ